MILKIRSNLFTIYRLFFIALFILMGITCIGIALLDNYAGIHIILTLSENDKQGMLAALTIVGVISLFVATTMIYLWQERRGDKIERRQYAQAVEFPERRSYEDRRLIKT